MICNLCFLLFQIFALKQEVTGILQCAPATAFCLSGLRVDAPLPTSPVSAPDFRLERGAVESPFRIFYDEKNPRGSVSLPRIFSAPEEASGCQ